MTTQEARQLIQEAAEDFISNPYNLRRDLEDNNQDNEEFTEAVRLLGKDWDCGLNWTVTTEWTN